MASPPDSVRSTSLASPSPLPPSTMKPDHLPPLPIDSSRASPTPDTSSLTADTASSITDSSSPSMLAPLPAFAFKFDDAGACDSPEAPEKAFGTPAQIHHQVNAAGTSSVNSSNSPFHPGTMRGKVGSTPSLNDFMARADAHGHGHVRRGSTPSVAEEEGLQVVNATTKRRTILSLPFLGGSGSLGASGHGKGDSKGSPALASSFDWSSVANDKKQGGWKDIRVDVSKEDMETVVKSWREIGDAGLMERMGSLTLECLLSQNPAYHQHISDPNHFPIIRILNRMVRGAEASLAGRDRRATVAEMLELGNRHMNEWGIGLKDYKCMVVGITYGLTDVHPSASTSRPPVPAARVIRAWQMLLRETCAVMNRGGMMGDEEIKKMKKELADIQEKEAKEGGSASSRADDPGCSVM
ncbi:hypothetical protein M427DRAFT_30899 [Gonapodya prolifera JEL478]|uniref:Uncharacterized protein n=1 Tax=Gonapodya prolifera (strain JEL478) TaxID=1344416 RepID=A0A139AJ00_GONPJ|nr:hypothetical protein M427DRAFT_30899 [Gonapodya prolifera JEL478]|eukprot:KXS16776.1 hypothetical protein M427DRAFT_30899 [Gonapodya prolifera JEL478]